MIEKLFTTYWSQFTLILLAVAYFIKRFFDLKTKKIEITYSLFQQNKINAVNQFFSNYAKVEHMWHQLSYWDAIEHKISSKELDIMIWPSLNDLKKSVLELKIYFSDIDYKDFENILSNFLAINKNLSDNYFNNSKTEDIIKKTNNFLHFKEVKLKENSVILKNLSKNIRTSYNQKKD